MTVEKMMTMAIMILGQLLTIINYDKMRMMVMITCSHPIEDNSGENDDDGCVDELISAFEDFQ